LANYIQLLSEHFTTDPLTKVVMFFTTNPARMPGKFAASQHYTFTHPENSRGKTTVFVITKASVRNLQVSERLTVTLA